MAVRNGVCLPVKAALGYVVGWLDIRVLSEWQFLVVGVVDTCVTRGQTHHRHGTSARKVPMGYRSKRDHP